MHLQLVKRPGSDKWYLRGTVKGPAGGRSVFRSTGTSDQARAEAIRIKAESRLLEETLHGAKIVKTFDEAAHSYLSAGGSPRFVLTERKDGTAKGLVEHFRGRQLRTITQDDLDAAARALYPSAGPASWNRQCHTPFIAIWTHAVKNDWAEPRKWSRPRKVKGTAARFRPKRSGTAPVAYDKAAAFVAAMSPAPAMVMTALFYTGLRPIELFALEAADVDLAQRWFVLGSSKTGEPRGVPMHEFLVPLFTALLPRGGAVFRTHKGDPYPLTEEVGGQIKSAINGARTRSGIKGISPYTARHTVSTQLVINGVHPHVKDQILGHAADDMSRHYTAVPQAPLVAAINTLPVPEAWRELDWWHDPLVASRRLIKNAVWRDGKRAVA